MNSSVARADEHIVDDALPEPFLSWIDPLRPLPEGVQLLPRAITPGLLLLAFTRSLVSFGGMSLFVLYLLYRLNGVGAGLFEQMFLAVVFLVLWIVPVLLFRRWWRSRRAAWDAAAGRLREGLFLGPAGMLLRLERNQARVIPWDRFLKVHRYYRCREEVLQLETLDGPIGFPDDRLDGSVAAIEQGVRAARPAGMEPPARKAGREFRFDPQPRRMLFRLVGFFGGSVVLMMVATAGVLLTVDGTPARDWWALGLFLALLLIFAAVGYAFYVLFRLSNYQCPTCGKSLPRVGEVRPQIQYDCGPCNVRWTVKMQEKRMPHPG
jgi:hypothetical protein